MQMEKQYERKCKDGLAKLLLSENLDKLLDNKYLF